MTIRLALIAAACLGVAGCTTDTAGLGGALSSLREPDRPARTCRGVAADAVALSARASAAAGLPAREPRVGELGLTEVAWPLPPAEPDIGAPSGGLTGAMGRLQAESETLGCAIAFRDSLPPPPEPVAVVVQPPEPPRAAPAGRSAWNVPPAPGAAQRPSAAPIVQAPAGRQTAAPVREAVPAPARQAAVAAPRPVPPVAAPAQAAATEQAPPARPARPRPEPVSAPPVDRSAVRQIPLPTATPPAQPRPAE